MIREILDHVDSKQETLLCTVVPRHQVFPLISFLLLFISKQNIVVSTRIVPCY